LTRVPQGLAKGQNIPQVGPVQVSWYTHTPAPPAVPSKSKSQQSSFMRDAPPHLPHEGEDERHHSPHAEEEVVANGWGGDEDGDGMGML